MENGRYDGRKDVIMSNHLKGQASPYLLQHADNPVEWYPWGEEAFAKAKREDKPVFLSVGYSTCHWCHVMAHESFENEEIAGILNRYFVSVKVDREERPDIDSVYMAVCQAFTGNGGWPMSVFMTAQQKPFFAGTYFPPAARYGRMGFRELLLAIADKWQTNREGLTESAEMILAQLRAGQENGEIGENRDKVRADTEGERLFQRAAELFAASFDEENGGFGSAPKFPTPHNLIFLTLYAALFHDDAAWRQVSKTLLQMRRGGIFDQIGYGFSRYSTDAVYLVPHFEKMLYDNALLILAYAAAYEASGEEIFLDTARKTAAYLLREMCGEEGEFFSAQDADCEGEEGKYYVWSYEEILHILGQERGEAFCACYGITEQGNFEGKNIPNLLGGEAIADAFDQEKKLLYDYRKTRAKLHLDDKVLTSWNALAICALSVLYRVTGERRYLSAAERAGRFIERYLVNGDRLYVSCRGHAPSVNGFLDDYAFWAAAQIGLYEATLRPVYLRRAAEICDEAGRQFGAGSGRGYFLSGAQNGSLIVRPKETYDGALPSGNAVMAYSLVRLSQLMPSDAYERAAKRQLSFLAGEASQYPAAHSMFLIADLFYRFPPSKITVVLADEGQGNVKDGETAAPDESIGRLPLYADVTLLERPTQEYRVLNHQTTYYVCKDQTCLPPTNQIPERW